MALPRSPARTCTLIISSYGCCHVSSSHMTTPKLNTSAGRDTVLLRMTSGADQRGLVTCSGHTSTDDVGRLGSRSKGLSQAKPSNAGSRSRQVASAHNAAAGAAGCSHAHAMHYTQPLTLDTVMLLVGPSMRARPKSAIFTW